MKPTTLLVLALACAALACRGPRYAGDRPVTRENASVHLGLAEEELGRGELGAALDRLIAVRSLPRLVPEERDRVERLLRRCAEAALGKLDAEGAEPDAFVELYELDLPPRLKARVGVAAAERMLAAGDPKEAFETIRRLESELPAHTERARAGDVLARAGFELVRDGGRYGLFFRYESRGIEALEFLVLRFPFHPRCDEAYAELARVYAGRRDLDLAIERAEDLLIYHPQSPLAPRAQADLPRLRLERLARDDYDRSELLRARAELEGWLARWPGHEKEAEVRDTLRRCRLRIARSDLGLARYYARIGSPFGARTHAERALLVAGQAGAEEEAREAREILAAEIEDDGIGEGDVTDAEPVESEEDARDG